MWRDFMWITSEPPKYFEATKFSAVYCGGKAALRFSRSSNRIRRA